MPEKQKKPFRVLSLDGGGIRGLYTACLLNSLSNRFKKPEKGIDIGKGFDLIVGTSTGAILATGLAYGLPISNIIDLYINEGPKIFTDPIPDSKFGKILWSFRNRNKPANENQVLHSNLRNLFGEDTVLDLWEKRNIQLCITAVNLATNRARVFKTPHIGTKNLDNHRSLVNLCLASSAAPIVLPIVNVPDPDNPQTQEYFIDGGLWANNPIIIALVEALESSDKEQPIEIVSIGTCPPRTGKIIMKDSANGGVFYWNFGIEPLTVAMDSQSDGHYYSANFLAKSISKLGKDCKIQRLYQSSPSVDQSRHLGLDRTNSEAIQALQDLAREDAALINGKINNSEENYSIVKSIFDDMPTF